MREAAIQIEQVSKSFQGREVLKNISCELNWGQVYGIVGNNGSGKTVLMKCICGLLPYDEGSIRVNGKKIGKDVDFPEDMGMIIESPGFLPGMTGRSFRGASLLPSPRERLSLQMSSSQTVRLSLLPSKRRMCRGLSCKSL